MSFWTCHVAVKCGIVVRWLVLEDQTRVLFDSLSKLLGFAEMEWEEVSQMIS
jgi:hypothetical protein